MRAKPLFILLTIAVLFAIGGVFIQRVYRVSWEEKAVGDNLCPDIETNKIAVVAITDGDQEVTIRKNDDQWHVAERFGYPANFEKLKSLVVNLTTETILRTLNVSAENYGRLQLASPEEENGGVMLKIRDAEDNLMTSVVFGKKHTQQKMDSPQSRLGSTSSARYVRVGRTVAMVGNAFSQAKAAPSEWLDSYFIKTKDLKRATLSEAEETRWSLQRSSVNDKWTLEGFTPTETKTLDTGEISGVNNAFKNASFDDVANPDIPVAKSGMDTPKVLTLVDKEDIEYSIRIGDTTDNGVYYLQADASYVGPEKAPATEDDKSSEGADAEASTDNDEKFAQKLEERKAKVKKLNQRLSKWTYLVSGSTVNDILEERSAFIKEKEDKEQRTDAPSDADKGAVTPPNPPPQPPTAP